LKKKPILSFETWDQFTGGGASEARRMESSVSVLQKYQNAFKFHDKTLTSNNITENVLLKSTELNIQGDC
jgi:hypothetical protein